MQKVATRLPLVVLLLALAACSSGGHTTLAVPDAGNAAPVGGNGSGSTASTANLTPLTQKEYSFPFTFAQLGAAPDGKIWGTAGGGTAALLNPAVGVSQYNAIAPTQPSNSWVYSFTVGKDGSLWYTLAADCNSYSGFLNSLSESGGLPVTYLAAGTHCYYLHFVAIGSDGNVWVTGNDESNNGNGVILKFVPGIIGAPAAVYPVPFTPGPITAGPDGALWFIDFYLGVVTSGHLDRIDTGGNVTQIADVSNEGFFNIVSGGGYLWVDGKIPSGYAIARFSTSGAETDYPVKGALLGTGWGIAATDSYVYFPQANTGNANGAIGQLNMKTGVIANYTPAGCSSFNPFGITIDPSGNVWASDASIPVVWEMTFPH
ncbi:MAG TPA: hypothetical protein VGG22_01045 [Candidatus Baltobacteraceae bacterium]|jgi:streptogramin lyase